MDCSLSGSSVHGILQAKILEWLAIPFSSGPHSTLTHLSWVALQGMAHSFIELDKAVVHVIRLASFLGCGFNSVCPLMDKDKRLTETS